MEIWKPEEESRKISDKISVVGKETFPYLDMEMKFDEDQHLCFGVYTKPNFQMNYLNIESCHPAACKNAVVRGVSIRLSGLTTRTRYNENKSLSDMYPDIDSALRSAGLLRGESKMPKLGSILDSREREMMEAQLRKEEWKKDKRNIYFLQKYDGHWRTPIHKTIKKLRDKRGLQWLRVRMIKKRHQNLKEMLLSDAQHKIMKSVVPHLYQKNTENGKCTCRSTHKIGGTECHYKEECETTAVVYKIKCKCCGAYYLGKTQRSLKCRCQEHYWDVGKFFKKRKAFRASLQAPLPSLAATSSGGSNNSSGVSTRSMTRRAAAQQPPTPNTPGVAQTPMGALISLLSPIVHEQSNRIPPTIFEGERLEPSENESLSLDSSTRPTNLTNNPSYQTTNNPPSTITTPNLPTTQLEEEEFYSASDGYPSDSTLNSNQPSIDTVNRRFAEAFGGTNTINELRELEASRATILRPLLEE